jgi:hypothetical protein
MPHLPCRSRALVEWNSPRWRGGVARVKSKTVLATRLACSHCSWNRRPATPGTRRARMRLCSSSRPGHSSSAPVEELYAFVNNHWRHALISLYSSVQRRTRCKTVEQGVTDNAARSKQTTSMKPKRRHGCVGGQRFLCRGEQADERTRQSGIDSRHVLCCQRWARRHDARVLARFSRDEKSRLARRISKERRFPGCTGAGAMPSSEIRN